MRRQRPSRLARAPPNIAHENRRNMYPGMQARVSDAEDSDLPRRTGHTYSHFIGSDHRDEERNSPMPPPRRDTRRVHEDGSDSGYGSTIGGSYSSASRLSSSNSSLATEDPNRNHAANLPHNGIVPRHPYPFGQTDRDRRLEQDPDMIWSPIIGWYDRRNGPYVRIGQKFSWE